MSRCVGLFTVLVGAVGCGGAHGPIRPSEPRTEPTTEATPTGIAERSEARATHVAAGRHHSCVRWDDGVVACAGSDGLGQLGGQGDSAVPRALGEGTRVEASEFGTCWFDAGGERSCVGHEAYEAAPRPVARRDSAERVVSGRWHRCELLETGAVRCEGDRAFGQLGDGAAATAPASGSVRGLDDAVLLAAGEAHTCALRARGDVVCWGANTFGQLGDGTREHRSTPVVFVRPR
ncbi:MAG: hypothetical protein NZ898_14540 [Myxococcota bacterium]|nr:hypothetical protein [Myxococcota bacterium]MDW8364107.1 hypothetical protein [Myxococcales bacterium]